MPGRARGGGRGAQRRVQVEGSAGRVCRGLRAGRKVCAQAFGESIHRVELPSTEPGKAVGGVGLRGEIRSSVWVWSIQGPPGFPLAGGKQAGEFGAREEVSPHLLTERWLSKELADFAGSLGVTFFFLIVLRCVFHTHDFKHRCACLLAFSVSLSVNFLCISFNYFSWGCCAYFPSHQWFIQTKGVFSLSPLLLWGL